MTRRNKSGLPIYCCFARDRHGKVRVRFRKGSFSTYLLGTPWTPKFMEAYGAALDGARPSSEGVGRERTRAGSISSLLVRFYQSPEFRNGNERTQRVARRVLERFREQYGDDLVRDLKHEHVAAIIGAMHKTPMAGNRLLHLLRRALDMAVLTEMIPSNPAAKVKGYSRKTKGFHTWSEEDVAAYEERHPVGSKARLALALMLYTGQRRCDAIRLGQQHRKRGRLEFRQKKTGAWLSIPEHPALTEALCAAPDDSLTFLVTDYSRPFSENGIGNKMREWCDQAGLPQCTAHGLRKAASRRLAELGMGATDMQAVTGHTTLSELVKYTRAADQKVRADRAIPAMPMRAQRLDASGNSSTTSMGINATLDKSCG